KTLMWQSLARERPPLVMNSKKRTVSDRSLPKCLAIFFAHTFREPLDMKSRIGFPTISWGKRAKREQVLLVTSSMVPSASINRDIWIKHWGVLWALAKPWWMKEALISSLTILSNTINEATLSFVSVGSKL